MRAQATTHAARRAATLGLLALALGPGCVCDPTPAAPDAGGPADAGASANAGASADARAQAIGAGSAAPATATQLCACFTPQTNGDWHEQGTQLQGTGLAGSPGSCGATQIPNGFFPVRSFSLGGMTTALGHPVSGVTVSQGQLHGTDATTSAPLGRGDWSGVELQASVDCIGAGMSAITLRAHIRSAIAYDEATPSLAPRPGLTRTANLYAVELFDPRSSAWVPACKASTDPTIPANLAIPSGEVWDTTATRGASTTGFTFACVTAVMAKCYTWGYVPWAPPSSAGDPAGLHQACTRMGRADYCGNGTSNTEDGHAIDMWDAFGIEAMAPLVAGTTPSPATLEAAWGPGGALCKNHYRLSLFADHPTCAPHPPAACAGANPCASASAGTRVCNASVPP